jgi:hypothetical protein
MSSIIKAKSICDPINQIGCMAVSILSYNKYDPNPATLKRIKKLKINKGILLRKIAES